MLVITLLKTHLTMFSKKEIIDILSDNSQNEELFRLADKTRVKYVGDEVYLRGLIEFSNICKCTCHYCGLRFENKAIERYRLSADEIIDCAKKAASKGIKTIVLQSGEDIHFTKEVMCKIITEIKKLNTALTLSIGERTFDDYKAFKDAGADRYLLRIETTDKSLYERLHPGMDFYNRLKCLKNLKKLGYETGSGSLVGLPGQSIESLADDILFFKENDFDMIGVGPFLPHPSTPLKDASHGDFTLSLKVMALIRILMKNINIPATTAMETLHQHGRILALQSGANVVMPNVTKADYKEKYEIYPDKSTNNNDIDTIKEKIISIGRIASKDFGFRKK